MYLLGTEGAAVTTGIEFITNHCFTLYENITSRTAALKSAATVLGISENQGVLSTVFIYKSPNARSFIILFMWY